MHVARRASVDVQSRGAVVVLAETDESTLERTEHEVVTGPQQRRLPVRAEGLRRQSDKRQQMGIK